LHYGPRKLLPRRYGKASVLKAFMRGVVLFVSIALVVVGVLDGGYELVRNFVRFICISCLGLG
jgi:hypothetical protein